MAATSSVPGARFVNLDNGLADFPQIYDVPLTVRRVAINLQVRLPDARRRSGGPLERAPGRFALGYAFGRPDKVRRCRGFVATCFLSAYRVAVSRSGACARGRLRAVREVCERRGHKDAATTLRIYVRAFDGRNAQRPAGTASQLSTRLGGGPMSTIILGALKRAKRALAVYRVSARGGSA